MVLTGRVSVVAVIVVSFWLDHPCGDRLESKVALRS